MTVLSSAIMRGVGEVTPASQPEQSFASERMMRSAVAASYGSNCFVVAEMPLEHGRPDLLVLTPDVAECIRRAKRFGARWLPTPAIRILNEIGVDGTALGQLGYEYNMGAGTVERHVRTLRAFGLAKLNGSRVHRDEPYRAPFTEVRAVELKLRDWKKALTQAASHSKFADYIEVVIDARFAHRVDTATFIQNGVGLIRASAGGICAVDFASSRQFTHRAALRMSVLERAWNIMFRQATGSISILESGGHPLSPADRFSSCSLPPH